MTPQTAGPSWPSAPPPAADEALSWHLSDIAELPGVRAALRRHIASDTASAGGPAADLSDRLVLAFDEMASNALRHGGGGVRAALRRAGEAYLIEVTDLGTASPPTPAVGRDPSQGGLGLYLIAELASAHGWYVVDGTKHVWALLSRT